MAESEKTEYVLRPFKAFKKVRTENLTRTNLAFCDDLLPRIVFEGRSFCLTGIFGFENGDRNKCEDAIRARGGVCWHHPNHNLDYLVIGTFVENAWAHKGYGRKIEAALDLKKNHAKCKIVPEAYWVKALQNTPELPMGKRISVGAQSRSNQLIQLQREVDEMKKSRALIVEILKKELKRVTYNKLVKRLRETGIQI